MNSICQFITSERKAVIVKAKQVKRTSKKSEGPQQPANEEAPG